VLDCASCPLPLVASNAWLEFKAMPLMLQFLYSTKKFSYVPVGAGDDYQSSIKP
jgi:hypothetical protein